MSTVLAAIDNSLAARPVLVAASALAHVLGADPRAIHVAEDDGRTARTSAEHLRVPFTKLNGEPAEQITTAAAAADVVAVVVGARRLPSDSHIGHLARIIADQIDKPVLVVPPEATPAPSFHRVLIAMEGTPSKARSIRSAIDVAMGADLDMVIVHVDDERSIPSFSDQAAHEVEAYTEDFMARYVHGVPKARLELRIGAPADQIMAVTNSVDPDLLALGWPRSSDGRHGAVAREVLDRSHVPVLLVALAPAAPGPDTAGFTPARRSRWMAPPR